MMECARCGVDVIEFTIQNEAWNAVIRNNGHERDDEYICCFCWLLALHAATKAGGDGTTPSCEGCGACCLGMGVPPFGEWKGDVGEDSEDPEFDALSDPLKQEIVAAMEVEGWAFKPCLWFDIETRRCKHYELRPVVCMVFEPGNPICLDDRRMAILKGFLPPEAADSGGREQSEE